MRCAPSPRAMKSGSPPTARNARTGLLTPPGNSALARASSFCDFAVFMAAQGVARRLTARCARADRSVRRGAAVARQAPIEHRREVVRVDRLRHVEAALRALERELHDVGRL